MAWTRQVDENHECVLPELDWRNETYGAGSVWMCDNMSCSKEWLVVFSSAMQRREWEEK